MTESTAPDRVLTDEEFENAEGIDEVVDEGDIAADYLEELLDIGDFDGDIDIEIRGGRTYLSIIADQVNGLDVLVGENGEVLDALQELTRLAVLAETGERSRLILDIAGFRAQRGERLKKLVSGIIEQVKSTGEPVSMDPMTAYERKQVHDLIAAAGLTSESEGEGADRHVVVLAG